jgi:hypothetical protein
MASSNQFLTKSDYREQNEYPEKEGDRGGLVSNMGAEPHPYTSW